MRRGAPQVELASRGDALEIDEAARLAVVEPLLREVAHEVRVEIERMHREHLGTEGIAVRSGAPEDARHVRAEPRVRIEPMVQVEAEVAPRLSDGGPGAAPRAQRPSRPSEGRHGPLELLPPQEQVDVDHGARERIGAPSAWSSAPLSGRTAIPSRPRSSATSRTVSRPARAACRFARAASDRHVELLCREAPLMP
ncbi:MAG: hypothetical protein M5U28_20955 [Sandaracinaceae bacterium]|nr:hypothetical protein [Sandaracinaceae bacterium]